MSENQVSEDESKCQLEPVRKRPRIDVDTVDNIQNETRVNHESIALLWYDMEIKEAGRFTEDVKKTEAMLRELNDFVQLFSDETACIQYMETFKNETIVLVISGISATPHLLDKAHSLRHVDTIFLFCMDTDKYRALLEPPTSKNSKIAAIFNERESLKQSIIKTVRAIEKQTAIFATYDPKKQKSNRNLTVEGGSFVWFQLIKETVQRIRDGDEDPLTCKEEMLSKCRAYYRDNAKEMRNIDEFERNYKQNEAISWYTRDSFIYKLINKALRTEDVEALYTYRYYIVDLCICLGENFEVLRTCSTTPNPLKLYRGMTQSKEEIQRLRESIGQLISTNSFLSTSRSRAVAEAYAGVGSKKTNTSTGNLESVIFEINVDVRIDNACRLADVSLDSPFSDEEEVLFDFATVFEIESMSFDYAASTWICVMTSTDKGSAIAKDYIRLQMDEINTGDVVILLGTYLFEMGEYKKSKDYFENLKRRKEKIDSNVLIGLGRAHYALDEYEKALDCFALVRAICLEKNPTNLLNAAKAAHYEGKVFRFRSEYDKAFSSFTESLNFYNNAGMAESLTTASVLSSLGWLYYYVGKDAYSLEHFQNALSILNRLVPFDHPDIAEAHMNIAQALYLHGDYDIATNHIETALEITRRIFPSKGIRMGVTLLNKSKILYKKQENEEALAASMEALEIIKLVRDEWTSVEFAFGCNNIGKIYYQQKEYAKADDYYNKALRCLKTAIPNGDIDTAFTLRKKSELYLALGELEKATDYIEEALQLLNRMFPDRHHRDIAKALHLLAHIHITRQDDAQALIYFRQAFEIWNATLVGRHPYLALCRRDTVRLYWRKLQRSVKNRTFSAGQTFHRS